MLTRDGRARQPARRGGFTLLELLVVIAIITILVTLTVGATVYYMNAAPEFNAEKTLKKLDTGLLQEWKAAIDTAEEEWRSGANAPFQAAGSSRQAVLNANGVNGDPSKGQRLWVQLRLLQEFPASYYEIRYGTDPKLSLGTGLSLPPKHAYQLLLPTNVGSATAPGPPNSAYNAPPPYSSTDGAGTSEGQEEEGACLLAALSQGRRGMVFNVEDAVGVNSIRTTTITTANGTPVRTLIDIWGTPLGFTRGSGQSPDILSAGKDQLWILKSGDKDNIASSRLRVTSQRGD